MSNSTDNNVNNALVSAATADESIDSSSPLLSDSCDSESESFCSIFNKTQTKSSSSPQPTVSIIQSPSSPKSNDNTHSSQLYVPPNYQFTPYNQQDSSTNVTPPSTATAGHHPYLPRIINKDKIPAHLHQFIENSGSSSSSNNSTATTNVTNVTGGNKDDHVREVTPANITLRTTATSGHDSPILPTTAGSDLSGPLDTAGTITSTTNNSDHLVSSPSNALALPTTINNSLNEDGTIRPAKSSNYVDITDYLSLPQGDAAKKLGIPTSTLSKRWKEAAPGRKWPYRQITKLEKEIMTVLHNIPEGGDMTPAVKENLDRLTSKRQAELRPVYIRL